MKKQSVFISYSSEDKDWANAFACALRNRGMRVWLDDHYFAPGESWLEAMEKGLRGSDFLAFVMSPENLGRHGLMFELGAAVGGGKRVVPILPKGTRVTANDIIEVADLPFRFDGRKAVYQQSPEETAEQFVAKLGNVAANGGTSTSSR